MALGRFVKGGGHDLGLDRALHVRDFLGALVDEQHDEEDVGAVGIDGIGDGLEEHGLTGAGRGDDDAALTMADGGEQIDDPGGVVLGPPFSMT